jgi:hypothetical protein
MNRTSQDAEHAHINKVIDPEGQVDVANRATRPDLSPDVTKDQAHHQRGDALDERRDWHMLGGPT